MTPHPINEVPHLTIMYGRWGVGKCIEQVIKQMKTPSRRIFFGGSLLDVAKLDIATAQCTITIATNDKEVTGTLYFMNELDAIRALERIKSGDIEYLASETYLSELPVEGGMDEEWKKLQDIGLIGMEWNNWDHKNAWGLRINASGMLEPVQLV